LDPPKRRRQIILDGFEIEFLRKLYGEVPVDNTVATVSLASRPIKNGDRLLAEDQAPLAGVMSPDILFTSNGKQESSAILPPIQRPSRISMQRDPSPPLLRDNGFAISRSSDALCAGWV